MLQDSCGIEKWKHHSVTKLPLGACPGQSVDLPTSALHTVPAAVLLLAGWLGLLRTNMPGDEWLFTGEVFLVVWAVGCGFYFLPGVLASLPMGHIRGMALFTSRAMPAGLRVVMAYFWSLARLTPFPVLELLGICILLNVFAGIQFFEGRSLGGYCTSR